MAQVLIVVLGLNNETEETIARRYGVVIGGGGNQSASFAKVKAQILTDVGAALGPVSPGFVLCSEDSLTSHIAAFAGMNSADFTAIGGASADGVILQITMELEEADLHERLGKANASTLTVPAATLAQRLLPLLSSLGVGIPCKVTVSGNIGSSDTARVQAGVAF